MKFFNDFLIFYFCLISKNWKFSRIYKDLLCLDICRFRFEHVLHKRDISKKSLTDCPDDICHKNIAFSIQAYRKTLQ